MVRLLCIFFLLIPVSTMSQAIQEINPQVPTSPQAEAFKQYGEYHINHFLGTPGISIFLYEINHMGYKIPLQLNYNPQPLRPGYNYDVYGHGWGFSGHSNISRTIEFLPDEERDFKIEMNKLTDYYYNCPGCPDDKSPVNLSSFNFAHDKFNVVMPNGGSFDFIIDNEATNAKTYRISNGRKVKISCTYSSGNISAFTIVDEDGIKYRFDGSDTANKSQSSTFSNRYVSWQLTRIDLPNTPQPITFNYNYLIEAPVVCSDAQILIADNMKGEVDSQGNIVLRRSVEAKNLSGSGHYSYRMKLLSSISYGSTEIKMIYRDPNATATYNYVDKIEIHEHSTLIKEIFLATTIYELHGPCHSNLKVAKLDTITIVGLGGLDDAEIYKCFYHSVDAFSGTDHWGYLNFHNTEYDVGHFNLFVGFDTDYFHVFSGASISPVARSGQDLNPFDKIKLSRSMVDNRQPTGPESHGVLSELRYPTGGYTHFQFENHEFLTSTDNNGNYIYERSARRKVKAAGFRVREIISYDSQGHVAKRMNYRYGAHLSAYDHTGLGVAVVDPNILTYMDYSAYHSSGGRNLPNTSVRNMVLGLDVNGNQTSFQNPFDDIIYYAHTWRWECTFSASNFRRILNGRPSVVYSEISVYYGDIDENAGKTVYKYNISAPGRDLLGIERDDVFFEEPAYFGNVIDYVPRSYMYNQIKEKVDYVKGGCKSCYNRVKMEEFAWVNRTQESLEFTNTNPYPVGLGPTYHFVSDHLGYKIVYNGVSLLDSKKTTNYEHTGRAVILTENYTYNFYNQLNTLSFFDNKKQFVEKVFVYPTSSTEFGTSPILQEMVEKNIISAVIGTTVFVNGKNISGSKLEYDKYPISGTQLILPARFYELETESSPGTYVLKNQILDYTMHGSPVEVVSSNGIRSNFLWGYNGKHIVVKADNIENGELVNVVTASLPSGFQSLESVMGNFPNQGWKDFNVNLRANLPDNVLITTYTYNVLGKVSSITDSNNITTYFSYDGFGRLKTAKDSDDNIVKHIQYNYKQQ